MNKVTGSPVGVIIAENINTNKNISFLLLVNKDLFIIFFLIRKKMTNGVWKDNPNKIDILEISWK